MDDKYLQSGAISSNLEILNKPPPTKVKQTTSTDKDKKSQLYLQNYGRQFGEQMTYSIGCAYGSGLLLGGFWGVLEGIKKGGENRKLFVNSIVNGSVTRGPFLGNQFAVMTMFYVASYNLINFVRGEENILHATGAGAFSGLLFKCAAGWKMAGRYSVAGGLAFTGIDWMIKNRF
jgi:mitochondrial import inner membrane translocase subunit TIM23